MNAPSPVPSAMPSVAEVLELPADLERAVGPDLIDVNGHMNVQHYLLAGATGGEMLCRRAGLDADYRTERRLSVFTAEHHLRYLSEMREGDDFSVHVRVLDRSARATHLVTYVVDRTHERLACVVEILLVHVDLETRRPVPFADDLAAGLDAEVERSAALTWPTGACGAIAVRR